MGKKIITSPSGRNWKQFQVRVPLEIANQIESTIEKTGVYKAGFLRVALVKGAAELAEDITILEKVAINSTQ